MPNGNMIVTEVPGRIRIITTKGLISEPVKGVPAVRAWGSRGLNDIILDPNFETNRKIYFAYLAPPPNMESDNSDKRYQQFAKERLEWNKLSREEKGKKPWGYRRVASATLANAGRFGPCRRGAAAAGEGERSEGGGSNGARHGSSSGAQRGGCGGYFEGSRHATA